MFTRLVNAAGFCLQNSSINGSFRGDTITSIDI
jgi:hypothetical protein